MPADTDRAPETDYLLDRLHNLRVIVPVFAEELASARRQAACLRRENDLLIRQVQELQRQCVLAGSAGAASLDVVTEPFDLLAGAPSC